MAVVRPDAGGCERLDRIVRRTVHAPGGYRSDAAYDFVAFFEFAEEYAATFRAAMAALRDGERNPERAYVREGPEWWSRRAASAAGPFSACAGGQ